MNSKDIARLILEKKEVLFSNAELGLITGRITGLTVSQYYIVLSCTVGLLVDDGAGMTLQLFNPGDTVYLTRKDFQIIANLL